MGDRSHLSIGEVLSLVQDEFPDVTISKIRFLESQGLLEPERTPSGYRKFYDADIERLQWILTQQRDNFLPLRVIRERLDEWDATGTPPAGTDQTPDAADLPVGVGATAAVPARPATQPGPATQPEPVDEPEPVAAGGHEPAVAPPEPPDRTAGDPAPGAAGEPRADEDDADAAESSDPRDLRHAAAHLAAASAEAVRPPDPEPDPEPVSGPARADAPEDTRAPAAAEAPADDRAAEDQALTAEELASRAGVAVEVVRQLEGFSMIASRRVGPDTYYDPEHLDVVRAARAFVEHGIEVRHLRMYKIAAEREAGVFEQLVMPLLKQRNPDARARARDVVDELAGVGEELHAALLRRVLRSTLP